MGAHTTHRVHANSVAAFDSLDLNERAALVLSAYLLAAAPMTDRDCPKRLGFTEPNAVRPRVTELVERGLLWECGAVVCEVTCKRVRICAPTSLARKARRSGP